LLSVLTLDGVFNTGTPLNGLSCMRLLATVRVRIPLNVLTLMGQVSKVSLFRLFRLLSKVGLLSKLG
jgi:hypothetical protein